MKSINVAWAIAWACCAIAPAPIQAQIVPDNSLGPERSRVNLMPSADGSSQYLIDQGATRGPNLFHSFSQFDIPASTAVYFTPATGVEHIFSRVTGQIPSRLDGILGVQGSDADLFLFNPSGIVLGPNARLDLAGSFIGSTAQAIQFPNGASFDAVTPELPAPLTVSVPLGLQVGQQAGTIEVQGAGHHLRTTGDPYLSPYSPANSFNSLQVAPQNTFALLGGDLALEGGNIQVPGGRVELGSVAQAGLVEVQPDIQGWSFTYPELTQFGDLHLTEQASIEVGGGPSSGNLHIQAGNIDLQQASVIQNLNFSPAVGGTLVINASESLTLNGLDSDIQVPTAIVMDQFGPGQAGDFKIRSPKITVKAGAALANRNYGFAEGGRLQLEVEQLRVEGFGEQQPDAFSRIATVALSSGRGGAIRVDAEEIDIYDGGFLGSVTLLDGQQGGDVWIDSDRITIYGESPAAINSLLGANHLGRSGRSGNLNINTRILENLNGGLVSTSSVAAGDAGDLSVNAQESITLRGRSRFQGVPSTIGSTVFPATPVLQTLFGLPATASGSSGNVFVQTPQLVVEQGAAITVDNSGIGRAGTLQINAENIRLQNQGGLDAFTLAGNGGNIQIQSELLTLIDEGSIFAVAFGENNTGDGGNIVIDSSIILGVNNSDILARAQQGQGGNIKITTEALLGLESRPQTTPQNDINASSNLGLDGTVQVNVLTVAPSTDSALPETELLNTDQLIAVRCEILGEKQFILSGRGGLPIDPTSPLKSHRLWTDHRETLSLQTAPRNNMTPKHQAVLFPRMNHIQEAKNWTQLLSGKIQLLASQLNVNIGHDILACKSSRSPA